MHSPEMSKAWSEGDLHVKGSLEGRNRNYVCILSYLDIELINTKSLAFAEFS